MRVYILVDEDEMRRRGMDRAALTAEIKNCIDDLDETSVPCSSLMSPKSHQKSGVTPSRAKRKLDL